MLKNKYMYMYQSYDKIQENDKHDIQANRYFIREGKIKQEYLRTFNYIVMLYIIRWMLSTQIIYLAIYFAIILYFT